jgi:ribosomal protein S18 acetylase RimI-like enzyme
MPYDSFAASIAEQRQRTYLDHAERHRLTQSLRAGSVSRRESLLRTALVRVRPIRPSDSGLLQGTFERLSLESRQFRFLFPKGALSPSELRYFTQVDHHDHEALVAVHRLDSQGLGVARYIRHRNDPTAADVAVTVIDEWHGRGLGTRLVTQLMERARCEGVSRFTAMVASDNGRARRLLRAVGPAPMLMGYDDGVAEYEIDLGPGATRPASARFTRLTRSRCSCA